VALTRIGASPRPAAVGLDCFLDCRVVVVCRHLTPMPSDQGEPGQSCAEWPESRNIAERFGLRMPGPLW
jgi:hypothetical protein